MPIYEYKCDACGKVFEEFQGINDAPLTRCSCGVEGEVHRLISRTSFVLKGTGWYETDFKDKKGSGGSNGSHAPADKKNGSSTETTESASASSASEAKETQPTEEKKPKPAESAPSKNEASASGT